MESKSRKRSIDQLTDITEPIPNAILHGAVTNISPIKKGRLNTSYFDATLADRKSSVRVVGFSPQHQIQLSDLHKAKSPVELVKCVVKHSRQGEGYDIMLKSNTEIKFSPKKLDMEAIMSSSNPGSRPITLDLLSSLCQYERVSVNVKVLKVKAIEEVGQEKRRKRDVIVADKKGTAKLVLWEEHVDVVEEGKSYSLTNFHVREYKGKKHLSMPKAEFKISTIDDLMDIVDEIPTDNDEHTTIHHVTIVGVLELDHYRSCLLCHARVEPQTPPDGKCTRSDCLMLQVFDLCQEQVYARVLLRHLNDDGKQIDVLCSAYGDIVYHLANKPKNHELIKRDLVLKKFLQVQLLTGKNIITSALHEI